MMHGQKNIKLHKSEWSLYKHERKYDA